MEQIWLKRDNAAEEALENEAAHPYLLKAEEHKKLSKKKAEKLSNVKEVAHIPNV